jgi:hypothetical protein
MQESRAQHPAFLQNLLVIAAIGLHAKNFEASVASATICFLIASVKFLSRRTARGTDATAGPESGFHTITWLRAGRPPLGQRWDDSQSKSRVPQSKSPVL